MAKELKFTHWMIIHLKSLNWSTDRWIKKIKHSVEHVEFLILSCCLWWRVSQTENIWSNIWGRTAPGSGVQGFWSATPLFHYLWSLTLWSVCFVAIYYLFPPRIFRTCKRADLRWISTYTEFPLRESWVRTVGGATRMQEKQKLFRRFICQQFPDMFAENQTFLH